VGRDINSRDASCAATSPRSNNSASEMDTGVAGLGLPGLNTVPTTASYGVDARSPRFRRRSPGW
jgi:hypothetical protein